MPHDATVVAGGPAERVREVVGWAGGDVEVLGEDTCRIRLRAESPESLDTIIVLLAVVADVQVCEPPEVAARVADLATRLGRENRR